MKTVRNIRAEFKLKKKLEERREDGTIELQGTSFLVNDDHIFGIPNKEYIKAEIEWYELQSRNVNDLFRIYGKEVAIWKDVATPDGWINSNYGWCIYSQENGYQYENVKWKLKNTPSTRQAVMVYIRPGIHKDATENGMHDFMCTTHVQYFLNGDRLDALVYMRSNDAIYGFNNDVAWQKHVQERLARDLSYNSFRCKVGKLIWNVGSLHVYPKHIDLIQ